MQRLIEKELWVPYPIGEVFEFFSKAENLEQITPKELSFKILTPTPIDMHEGTLIDYQIKLKGIPMNWRTLISAWEPPYKFADDQLKGPYQKWHHVHSFEEKDGGTIIRDRVEYKVAGGPFEPLIHKIFVAPQLAQIFGHRAEVIEKIFPARSA